MYIMVVDTWSEYILIDFRRGIRVLVHKGKTPKTLTQEIIDIVGDYPINLVQHSLKSFWI